MASVICLPCIELSSANFRISSATTANPFPVSPAWAASMAAFIANRFVWSAMFKIMLLASISEVDFSAIFDTVSFAVCAPSLPLIIAC